MSLLKKIYFIYVIIILIVSCNKNNDQLFDKVFKYSELIEAIKFPNNSDISKKVQGGIINTDCDYYIYFGGAPDGKLFEGQNVIILGNYIHSINRDGSFNIKVLVQTIDKSVKGNVDEQYITYNNITNYDLWFNNVLMIHDFYYRETKEDIYDRLFSSLIKEGYSEEYLINMMNYFYSEWKMMISERYLCIGMGELYILYEIQSIIIDDNVVTIIITGPRMTEYKIILFDDGEGVEITQINEKSPVEFPYNLIERELNIRYVPLDRERLLKMREPVLQQIQNERNK